MNIRKYIATVLEATEADEVQIEVHIDENMNVNPLSPSLIRFNVKRTKTQAVSTTAAVTKEEIDRAFQPYKSGKITPPPVEPEGIVEDLKDEKVSRRYRPRYEPHTEVPPKGKK